jgi:hypothetical protein
MQSRQIRSFIRRELNQRGYYKVPSSLSSSLRVQPNSLDDFHRHAKAIMARHRLQDKEAAAALQAKYQQPVFGQIRVWRLLELLAQCIDPASTLLYCTSQLTHVLQMLECMERNGVSDQDMFLAALLHDLGKVVYLTGEAPENVDGGGKHPIGYNQEGSGLDNCLLTWDHGDIVYTRMKSHIPDEVAWLIRYHSITPACIPLMDERDRAYYENYYKPFYDFDCTNIFYFLPSVQLTTYRDRIEELFPKPVLF